MKCGSKSIFNLPKELKNLPQNNSSNKGIFLKRNWKRSTNVNIEKSKKI